MAANRDSSSTPASAINKDLAGEPDSPEPESMDELGVFYTPENSAVDWQDMSQGPTEDEEGAAYANGVVPTILAEQTASVPEVLQSIIDAAVLAEMASVANAGIEETNGGKDPLDSPATSGTPADYYDLLGLSTSATTAEIVIAYRRRARDVADLSTSDPLYVSIKTAYDTLSQTALRHKYDESIKPDLYRVLGVVRTANLRQIIVAYRKLARSNHPDKGGELRAFDMIKEAYRVLSDPDKRSEYDRHGFTSDELEKPCVRIQETPDEKGRGVFSTRSIGMGEVILSRERPFAAVLSSDESAYRAYCHNCFVSLGARRVKEKCMSCGAHYCAKMGCGLHCEQHQRECVFTKAWKDSDLCIYSAAERPSDKMLFLLHAVYNGGLVFEEEHPLVAIKSAPLQINVQDLFDNAGHIDAAMVEENHEYASYVAKFLRDYGSLDDSQSADSSLRELVKLLRYYDTNAITIRDDVASRGVAKGIYLSVSMFNHSCAPNAVVTFEGDCATVRATRHIDDGEELCLAYIDTALPREARRAQLRKQWRFDCACERCLSVDAQAGEDLVHGAFCPYSACRHLLVPVVAEESRSGGVDGAGKHDEDLRPNALSVSSVPYMDQSFLPSIAGYTGDRVGYDYQAGRHGMGYYQKVDEWGEAIVERGAAIPMHACTGCGRTGADVHLQKALVLTAERHKFFHCHKQSAMDPRIAALQTSAQLRQASNLELSCLHPFHPSVAETFRAVYRMHMAVGQYGQAIQLLQVLAARDETVYGVVAPQTAHTSWLLADAHLRRSDAELTRTYTCDDAFADAGRAADWAQKALQIMSVLYGRNHQLTYATHVTLDMAHFRVEHEEKRREDIKAAETERAEMIAKALVLNGGPSEGEISRGSGAAPSAPPSPPSDSLDCVTKALAETSAVVDLTAEVTPGDDVEARVLCPGCATVFELKGTARIGACPSCRQFCTAANAFVEAKAGEEVDAKDPFGLVLADIMKEHAASSPNMHLAGEMLPTGHGAPLSCVKGLPKTRAATAPTAFYDANMRVAIAKIVDKHKHEWAPCDVCTRPRAAKQCTGCKTARYCTIECARKDYKEGHKELCNVMKAQRLAVVEREAELKKAPKRNAFGF